MYIFNATLRFIGFKHIGFNRLGFLRLGKLTTS